MMRSGAGREKLHVSTFPCNLSIAHPSWQESEEEEKKTNSVFWQVRVTLATNLENYTKYSGGTPGEYH